MKKFIFAVAALLAVAMMFTACGKKDDVKDEAVTQTQQVEEDSFFSSCLVSDNSFSLDGFSSFISSDTEGVSVISISFTSSFLQDAKEKARQNIKRNESIIFFIGITS